MVDDSAAQRGSDPDCGRYLADRDETAFAGLVRRHGAMVLSVCRRASPCPRRRRCLPGHLSDPRPQGRFHPQPRIHRRLAARRRLSSGGPTAPRRQPPSGAGASRRGRGGAGAGRRVDLREVRAALDEELNALPEKYRAPLVLCYLEGRTRDEAARQLGWGLNTLRGRLERGRGQLRGRLLRRGLSLSAAWLAAALGPPPARGEALVLGGVVRRGPPPWRRRW